MHGIVHSELQRFVIDRHGKDAWSKLVSNAGLTGRAYIVSQAYPDEEIGRLVGAASTMTGKPVPVLLEEFGTFVVPSLLKIYKAFVKPDWRTLDVLDNTERMIHKVVRMKNPGATPPELHTKRVSPTEVMLRYSSQRRMCAFARGLLRGLGDHFGETIAVDERECMHEGASACVMSVRSLSLTSKPRPTTAAQRSVS